MGILDLVLRSKGGQSGVRRRGKAKSAAEKLKALTDKAVLSAITSDPTLLDELVRQQIGLKRAGASNPIRQMVETVSELREAGFIDNPKAAGSSPMIEKLVEALGPTIITELMALMRQAAVAGQVQQTPHQPVIVQHRPAQVTQPAPAPGIPPATTAETPDADTDDSDATPEQAPEEPMTIESLWLIGQLKSKSPEQRAQWLVEQKDANVARLVSDLCTLPDAQLPLYLEQLAAASPRITGALRWLASDWPAFLAAVHALRQLQATPPTSEATP